MSESRTQSYVLWKLEEAKALPGIWWKNARNAAGFAWTDEYP